MSIAEKLLAFLESAVRLILIAASWYKLRLNGQSFHERMKVIEEFKGRNELENQHLKVTLVWIYRQRKRFIKLSHRNERL